LTLPSEYVPRINQGYLSGRSTLGSESGPSNPPLTSPVERPSPHDPTLLSHFSTPPSQTYEYVGRGGDSLPSLARQYHHFDAPRSIHGSTFITTENINHQHGEVGIHILSRAIASEALYDSAERFDQPKCHPDTRIKLLDNLYNWAIDPTSQKLGGLAAASFSNAATALVAMKKCSSQLLVISLLYIGKN
jgi:hypothetical protein